MWMMQGIGACALPIHTIIFLFRYHGLRARGRPSYVRGPRSYTWSILRSWSSVLHVCGPDIAMAERGADRGMAWALLEQLYPGFNIREERTEPFVFKINRVCGVSDRLTGSPGSTYVFCLRATLLWLLFCLWIVTSTI